MNDQNEERIVSGQIQDLEEGEKVSEKSSQSFDFKNEV